MSFDSPQPIAPSQPENSRRRAVLAAIGVATVVGVGAVIALSGGDSPDTVATESEPIESTTTTTVAPTTTEPIFVAASSSSTPPTTAAPAPTTTAAPTTTLAPTTTAAPTTTLAPTTTVEILPEQPDAPIAPPPDPRGYEDQIQIGGISIPKLGVDEPLLEGIRLTTLDRGPGHWPGTALPGENGNVVVAAHRTSHGAPFRNIDQLVAGDIVQFSTANGVVDYAVTGTQIVTPDAVWIVNPTENATATLFACHPPGSVSHRIVVNLELAE